jgi:hypothetical protein
MRALDRHQPACEDALGLRGSLVTILASVLLLAAAAVLLRVVGWTLFGVYPIGICGVVGLARGMAELPRAIRAAKHPAIHEQGEEVGDVPTHPGRL